MGIQVSNQMQAYMRRRQIENRSALQILSGGGSRKNKNLVSYSGSKVSRLCVSGKQQSALSMNMYDARGRYTHESSFTGIFHYDVYMYERNGKRYIRGSSGDSIADVIEDSDLDYFYKNMGNPWKMASDFNCAEGTKIFKYAAGDKSGGALIFQYKGRSQVIPASALPKLHPEDYPALKAKDNVLMLQSHSFYRFETGSEDLVWAVTEGGQMGEITTNNWLYDDRDDNKFSYKAGRLLSQLKTGNLWMSQSGENGAISYNEAKKIMAAVGIKDGKFSIGVDGEAKDYYLCSSGWIMDAESMERWVDVHNTCDYFAQGYKEGDMVKVTDRLQLPVDKDGHVHTNAEELGRHL